MGSDHAPFTEIDGALAATRDFGVGVILVGQPHKVEPELRRCGWRGDGDHGIELVEAAEVIAMDEAVANAVRRKKKSSLRIGSKLVSEGRGDGFVSAGNTGAAMATAKMVIGMLSGVRSEEHTSELQSQSNLVCRLLLEKKKKTKNK